MSAPFMQLYVADYLGDTRHLTTEQHGAYLLLLMTMWRSGGVVANDEIKIARITGLSVVRWRKISPDVLEFFTEVDGGLTQARLAAELAISEEKSEKRSQSGKAGARAKALKNNKAATANASRTLKHSPEPEPEPEERVPPTPKGEAKNARRKPETALPGDFPDLKAKQSAVVQVSEAGKAVKISTEAEKFRNHAAQTDRRARDWPAAWRNWIINACERAPALGLVQRETQTEHDPWPMRMRAWANDDGWNHVDWGPEPFEPGCKVPAHHLPLRAAE